MNILEGWDKLIKSNKFLFALNKIDSYSMAIRMLLLSIFSGRLCYIDLSNKLMIKLVIKDNKDVSAIPIPVWFFLNTLSNHSPVKHITAAFELTGFKH